MNYIYYNIKFKINISSQINCSFSHRSNTVFLSEHTQFSYISEYVAKLSYCAHIYVLYTFGKQQTWKTT